VHDRQQAHLAPVFISGQGKPCSATYPREKRGRPGPQVRKSLHNRFPAFCGAAMTTSPVFPLDGGCDCGQVRYRIDTSPLFVHCCHCRWCQRETGSAFALNAMIEADRLTVLAGPPEMVHTPSASGRGQPIARCPRCRIALWSHYAGAGPLVSFVRVGTLDTPDRLPPDIHIFTASKQPWVVLPPGTPAVPEYYRRGDYWPPESLARWQALAPALAAQRGTQPASEAR
jgi:hypothetical protein